MSALVMCSSLTTMNMCLDQEASSSPEYKQRLYLNSFNTVCKSLNFLFLRSISFAS